MVGGAVAPLLINQASQDARFQDHPGYRKLGIESYIAVPLFRNDGQHIGTLCALDPEPANLTEDDFAIFHLLAQLLAYELEAEEQVIQREAHFRALEDFISVATHDLRQPLTTLYGRVQLLQRRTERKQTDSDITRLAGELMSDVRRTLRLSTLLLDAARIEAGSFFLETSRFDLIPYARNIAHDVPVSSPEHDIGFESPETLEITADAQRLEQVLRNLLDNAVKYVPAESGPILFRIWTDSRPHHPELHIQVQDRGPGVSDDDLTRLFERQFRGSSSLSSGTSGSGLGLYITRKIVEAHNGSIRAEHSPGGGLTITLSLPMTPDDERT